MKRIIVLLTTLLLAKGSFSQDTTITKGQMYEDFDYLTDLIESTNPYLDVKKHLFEYSILDSIIFCRTQIEKCASFTDFQLIIKRVLNTCIDGHSVMVSPYPYPKINLFIPLTYVEGNYYIKRDFTIDSVEFKTGSKLIAINGNSNIHSEIEGQVMSRYLMRWDNKVKQFYSESFYLSDEYIHQGTITLDFEIENDTIQHTFEFDDVIDIAPFNAPDEKRIEYFESENILYIRVPEMAWHDGKFFRKQIPKIAKGQEIKTIVIDVRYNMGGSSLVGRNIFRSILPESLEFATRMAGNSDRHISGRYKSQHGFNKISSTEFIDGLDSIEVMSFINETEEIKPYRKSIRHSGNIYIIGNEHIYSAGGAIFMFANHSNTDNIYSIGTPTGWFLGEFTDPIHYSLPNSKLEIKIGPSMSLSNVNDWSNIMLDSYDFTISPSVENYLLFYSQSEKCFNKEYLLTLDPYFKPILENR